ncbi:MAG: glutathionylspermidine synthase family protein [Burkholderiales bacterium]
MHRELLTPRPDWPQKMEAVGFGFHSIDGIYWDERACYRFSAAEVDILDDATAELHALCMAACAHVIEKRRYAEFAIPELAIDVIEASWRSGAPTLFGRFDIAWDGEGPPKLLEYNADTPTSLIEASVAQWHWLAEVRPGSDQFNSLHEKLIARWQEIAQATGIATLHLACDGGSEEDVGNLDYMADVATQAGLAVQFIDIRHIGWDAGRECFVDERNAAIDALFKLYPWEWMVREEFGSALSKCDTMFVEPAWKMILSNKALLPLLWELNPGHPNLLPAYFDRWRLSGDVVKKPLLSREGANVTIDGVGVRTSTGGDYGAEGFIYQGYQRLPDLAGDGQSHMVIGSWVVGDSPAGIGLREDESPITKNTSRFLPHYFE